MTQLRNLAYSALVATCLLSAFQPAFAQDDGEQIVVTGRQMPSGYGPTEQIVKIGDLNLSTKAGVDEMEQRVTAAVRAICRTGAAPTAAGQQEGKTCQEFAWASARPQMDQAVRTAAQRARR